MTITVELPPEIEERFVAEAKARGLSVDEYARVCLSSPIHSPEQKPRLSADEMNRRWDAIAAKIPDSIPPLSDYAVSRESIYTREDEW